jgi:hypothetical protein
MGFAKLGIEWNPDHGLTTWGVLTDKVGTMPTSQWGGLMSQPQDGHLASDIKSELEEVLRSEKPLDVKILLLAENKLRTTQFPPCMHVTVCETLLLLLKLLRRCRLYYRARVVADWSIVSVLTETTPPALRLSFFHQLAKILWSLSREQEATLLLVSVCHSEPAATRLDDVEVVKVMPRLLSKAGLWLGRQRLEHIEFIRREYFGKAIQICAMAGDSGARNMIKVKVRYVKVVDPELTELLRTSTPKQLLGEQVRIICEILSSGFLSGSQTAWFASRLLSFWFNHSSVTSATVGKFTSPLAVSGTLLPFFYQIAGRIGEDNGLRKELFNFITESARVFPYTCLPAILQLRMVGTSSGSNRQPGKVELDRSKSAESIIERIRAISKEPVDAMLAAYKFYFNLAMTKALPALPSGGSSTRGTAAPAGPRRVVTDINGYAEYARQISLGHAVVLTSSSHVIQKSLITEYTIADSGKSLPKIFCVVDVTGRMHRQIVKGNDDLRNDAVLQQLFSLVDSISSSGRLRSYKVVPISACAGIAEWVNGTITIGNYLVGYPNESTGAHCRYRPDDFKPAEMKNFMVQVRQQSKNSPQAILDKYNSLVPQFKPCMHYFFYENFFTPKEWYSAQTSFASSVAATSIVGYVVGLGDRHPNNILIDLSTGEVVHIDYGICFDAGRFLKIPEIVPFRLTRDMVDGLGILGVQGPFSRICEEVLVSIKTNSSLLTAIVEVFVVDPLFNWAVASLGSDNAQAALEGVKKKLQGFLDSSDVLPLTPTAQIHRLIRSATDPRNLAVMFAGWQPWL